MTIGVRVSPSDLKPFRIPEASLTTEEPAEEGDEPQRPIDALLARLQIGYLQRIEDYKTALVRAQRNNLEAGDGFPQSQYPRLKLKFKDENEATVNLELMIDDELWTTLFDLYAYYGPRGFLMAEEELDKQLYESNDRTYVAAAGFFYYTVNCLNLLIRQALLSLEEAATGALALKLGNSARFVTAAYRDEFSFQKKTEQVRRVVYHSDAPVTETDITYRMPTEKAVLKETTFAALKKAVAAKEVYERRVKRARIARQHAEEQRQVQALSPAPTGNPGFRSPYDDNRDAQPTQAQAEKTDKAMADAKQAESDAAAAKALFDAVSANVFFNSPAALLALPKLSPGFTEEEMQDTLGGLLFEFYEHIELIVAGLANASPVATEIAGLKDGGTLAEQHLETLFPQQYSLNHSLVHKALDKVGKNPRYYSLLAASVWQELCARDDMDPFEYIVARHWLATMDEVLEETRIKEADWRTFWQSIGIAASALSLAELAIRSPAVAGAVATVRTVADIFVLLHAVYSVVTDLEALDVAAGESVIAFNLEGMTGMMRLAAILNDRREFRDQAAFTVAFELGLLPYARFRAVKRIMQVRGFYQDIDTLFGQP
ncbi:MAG: hypothetical protein E8D47_05245 [Nitrospira sp.]|nr:MAG: hypothetical protein E8D47_05245 [Nitrospira sp.]